MPYYGPLEDSDTIFLERTFLGGGFVTGVGYGVQLVLYVICVQYLWRERKRRRAMGFLLAYVTLLLSLSSLWAAIGTWTIEDIYINNRNYPGGPWTYFLATQNLPENVIFIVTLFVLTFLSDLLVLWRCWVIWTTTSRLVAYVIVAFPVLILLASFALGTIWCLQSSQPGLSLYSKIPIAFGTSYYVTSLSVNVVVTVLIVLRLALHRRSILENLPPEHARHYLSVAAIVVESAALYSFFALAFIISYALNNPINQIFLTISSSCQQIAGYLIILRVAQGRSWSTNTLTATTGVLSTVKFSAPMASTQIESDRNPVRVKDIEAEGNTSLPTKLEAVPSSHSRLIYTPPTQI
ncbi:hypothetical protein M378DRAFT_94038 [Amanita muscaria Koide BX008]|uniref:Uncharacterized protein n=1 Tax=Amanita muscaria (strain Koide BX008) TaxID=946122 RepID=A0A0C2T668_AMAMK|nr:hypothetical protein M378DRAFT_94038 [Amanita muscaria Koide BX008]